MRVVFKTNLDWYKTVAWPVLDNAIPHKGETVNVHPGSELFCNHNKIPTQLEVVDVTYYHDKVVCELHYKKINIELAKLTDNGIKHLMKN